MKSAILFSTLFFSAILPAPARIGETLEQCRARYGPEHPEFENPKSANKVYWFLKNGFVLQFIFDAGTGKARFVEICKMAGDDPKKLPGSPMTEEERKLLLDANGNGQKWIVKSGSVVTEDKKFSAYGYHPGSYALTVISQEPDKVAAKAAADKAASNAKQSVKGF